MYADISVLPDVSCDMLRRIYFVVIILKFLQETPYR